MRYNIIDPGSLVTGETEDVSVVLANLQAIQAVLNDIDTRISGLDLTQDGASIMRVYTLDVAFDDAGIEAGIAIPGYVPKKGDLISVDSTFLLNTLWNVTALGDIFVGPTSTDGVFISGGSAAQLDSPVDFDGFQGTTQNYHQFLIEADADAVYAVVSQDGTRNGTPTGAAAGSARVKLIVYPYSDA